MTQTSSLSPQPQSPKTQAPADPLEDDKGNESSFQLQSPKTQAPAGFLEDDKGNKSSIRLMSFIALLSAIAFSVGIFWQTSNPAPGQQAKTSGPVSEEFLIVLSFLSVSFGGKVIQKFAENMPEAAGDEK